MNDNEKKYVEKDNIVNKPSEFYKVNDDEKLNAEKTKIVDSWEPNWVRLSMLGVTFHSSIEQNGMLVDSATKTPAGFVDVPENLADDVSRGLLDPFKYTREQLLQLSIERHNREQGLSDMFSELEKNDLGEMNHEDNYHI